MNGVLFRVFSLPGCHVCNSLPGHQRRHSFGCWCTQADNVLPSHSQSMLSYSLHYATSTVTADFWVCPAFPSGLDFTWPIFDTWAWYFHTSFLTSFLTLGNYPDYPLQPEYKPEKFSWIQWARDVFIVPMAHHGPGFRPKEPYSQVPVRSLPPACPRSGSGPQPFWAAAISRYDSICIQM